MQINKLTIDSSKWVRTKLGDLAEDISQRVDNPANSKYDKFVGLDCLVSGELKIKKWSPTNNINSSAKAFQIGDILFARRNAYLKRASLVDFEGCCSGDAFVLRENHNKIVPGFLSFIVNSDKLWVYANSNAEGTMSKRVKWRDLANYELLLPPKTQQAELAELLWALDNVIEKDLAVLKNLESVKKVHFENFYRQNKMKYTQLAELVTQSQYGINNQLSESGEIPVLRMNNLNSGKLDLKDLKYVDRIEINEKDYILNKGDILFNRTNSYELVGKVSLFEIEGDFTFASYLIRLVSNKKLLDPHFLNYYLNSDEGVRRIRKFRSPGVNQSNINPSNLLKVEIPVLDIEAQKLVVDITKRYIANSILVESKIESSKSLQKSLINQLF